MSSWNWETVGLILSRRLSNRRPSRLCPTLACSPLSISMTTCSNSRYPRFIPPTTAKMAATWWPIAAVRPWSPKNSYF